MTRWMCLLAACWLLAGCGAARLGAVRSTSSRGTVVKAEVFPDDRVQITITSTGGIGSSEIAIDGGRLPKRVVVLLHVKGLENLTLAYGGRQIQGFVTSGAPHTVHQRLGAAGAEPASDLGPDSPFWMPIRLVTADGTAPAVPLANGWIEVELPPDFYAANQRTFTLDWVDFYR